MRVLLMHPDRDFDPQQAAAPNERALREDLGLDALLATMAGEDEFLLKMARAALLARARCDRDTILLKVHQVGNAACHEGYKSCFFRQVTPEGLKVVGRRVFDPDVVYGER